MQGRFVARATIGAFSLCWLICAAGPVPAQMPEQSMLRLAPEIAGADVIDPDLRLLLATADSRYPVTPGDVYRITYQRAGEIVVNDVRVENDYGINLNLFGQINARGSTFEQLRPRIQQIVENAIPRSLPSVSLVSVGVFRVRIVGALAQSRVVTAWGLSRLSDIVRDHLTAYSSIRSVTIRSADGQERSYDLFRAISLGEEQHDPHVRPGDTVVLSPARRVIHVGGEVNQAGRIELSAAETIHSILAFVRGAGTQADLERVRITRADGDSVRTFFVNMGDRSLDFELRDGDIVRVPSRITDRPVVYVEGQIRTPMAAALPAETPVAEVPAPAAAYGRAVVPIGIGETLHGVLSAISADISAGADLARAQLLRNGRPVDLPTTIEQLLFGYRPQYDVELQPFDRIVIPRDPSAPPDGEPSVLITGGVNAPGQYPVLAGMDAYAHIRRAGGFDRELNTNEQFRIYNARGERKPDDSPIESGDHIEVLRNNFVYSFNRHFPIVATGVGFLATIVVTLALFGP